MCLPACGSYSSQRPQLDPHAFLWRPHKSSVTRHTAAAGSLRPPSTLEHGLVQRLTGLLSSSEHWLAAARRQMDTEGASLPNGSPAARDPANRHTSTGQRHTGCGGRLRWACSWGERWWAVGQCRSAAEERESGERREERSRKYLPFPAHFTPGFLFTCSGGRRLL